MERATFNATMAGLKQRRPFVPFTVVLLNGSRVEVDHPDAVLVRDGTGLYAAPGGIPWIFDYRGVNQIIGDIVGQTSDADVNGGG